jgi:hypothetical protein
MQYALAAGSDNVLAGVDCGRSARRGSGRSVARRQSSVPLFDDSGFAALSPADGIC